MCARRRESGASKRSKVVVGGLAEEVRVSSSGTIELPCCSRYAVFKLKEFESSIDCVNHFSIAGTCAKLFLKMVGSFASKPFMVFTPSYCKFRAAAKRGTVEYNRIPELVSAF